MSRSPVGFTAGDRDESASRRSGRALARIVLTLASTSDGVQLPDVCLGRRQRQLRFSAGWALLIVSTTRQKSPVRCVDRGHPPPAAFAAPGHHDWPGRRSDQRGHHPLARRVKTRRAGGSLSPDAPHDSGRCSRDHGPRPGSMSAGRAAGCKSSRRTRFRAPSPSHTSLHCQVRCPWTIETER